MGRGDHVIADALTAQSVALIVKKYADAAGLDVANLSGHSLRAGFITSAADNRASISRIMEVSRHRDPRSVETYVRRADRYNDHAGDGFLGFAAPWRYVVPGLVEEIQRDAVDEKISVATVLRKVKVAAAKLRLPNVEAWVEHELNGYPGEVDLPDYRKLRGRPHALDPYNGWLPIFLGNNQDFLSDAPIRQSLASVEDLVSRYKGGFMELVFPQSIIMKLNEILHTEVGRMSNHIQVGQIQGIIEVVRNRALQWAIDLERAGVTGEGMSFNDKEKTIAGGSSVTNFNIHSIGTFAGNMGSGNTSGDISVSTSTSTQILEIVRKVRAAVPQLERDGVDGPTLSRAMDEIEHEAKKQSPDGGKLRDLLSGAKDVLVGAAGNLTAEGAMALILEALKSLS